jgi:nicotinamidase/pyrazinamidase
MDSAIVVVDMLNDFTLDDAPLKVEENKKIIPNIKQLIEQNRTKSHIVYVCDAHSEFDKEFQIWPKHCLKGTKGAQIVDELRPNSNDFIVHKATYDGFYNTVLDELLKNLGVDKIVIAGCVSNICILHTASSAVLRGYNVEIPLDCIASLDEQSKNCAISHFKNVLNINLT